MRRLYFSVFVCSSFVSAVTGLSSQEQPVLESVSYLSVGEYAAGGANTVDISATSSGDENAISLEDFTERLEVAFASGNGGVIDFELDLPGDSLRAIDRTLVNAYIRDQIDGGKEIDLARLGLFDNPLIESSDDPYTGALAAMNGEDEALLYDVGDPVEAISITPPEDFEAETAQIPLVDPNRVIVVEDRSDREFLDSEENPLSNTIRVVYSELRAIFGTESDRAITIRRGSRHISESDLASPSEPGPREFVNSDSGFGGYGTINDEFFFQTRDVSGSSLRAVSGSRALGGGGGGDATSKDLLFDPRDNITVFGFTLLSFGNFQYWQGNGPESINPDNIIVKAFFSDGSSTDYRGTTQQSTGRHDTFFGIEAPSGESIARVQIRVVGNNFRTFTNLDDLAFITEPAAPYLSSGAEPTLTTPYATQGRPFFRMLEFQGSPTSVEIPGLETLGLDFDLATGLISGSPAFEIADLENANIDFSVREGGVEINLPITMVRSDGESELERTEEISFIFLEGDGRLPLVTSNPTAVATLGRDFAYEIETDLPEEDLLNLDVFLVSRRIVDGEAVLFPLETLGLSLAETTLQGKPLRTDLVGDYELEIFVVTPEGSSVFSLALTVVPPTQEPNFDGLIGNTQTDLIFHDNATGSISIALLTKDDVGGPVLNDSVEIVSGLPQDSEFFLGDFNGDANTDIVTYSSSNGFAEYFMISVELPDQLIESTMTPTRASEAFSDAAIKNIILDLIGLEGIEEIFDGEETFSFDSISASDLLNNSRIFDPLVRELSQNEIYLEQLLPQAIEDRVAMFTSAGLGVEWVESSDFLLVWRRGLLGDTGAESPWQILGKGDLNADGLTDLILRNESEGETVAWITRNLAIDPAPFPSIVEFSPRLFIGDFAINHELLSIADFNGDGGSDLLWRIPDTNDYIITPFNRDTFTGSFDPTGSIKRSGRTLFTMDPNFEFLETGDTNGDGLDDILWLNSVTGFVAVWEMPSEDTVSILPSSFFDETEEIESLLSRTEEPEVVEFIEFLVENENMIAYLFEVSSGDASPLPDEEVLEIIEDPVSLARSPADDQFTASLLDGNEDAAALLADFPLAMRLLDRVENQAVSNGDVKEFLESNTADLQKYRSSTLIDDFLNEAYYGASHIGRANPGAQILEVPTNFEPEHFSLIDLDGNNADDLFARSDNSLSSVLLGTSDSFLEATSEFMQDGVTPRPQVLRDNTDGLILVATRAITLQDRYLQAGQSLGLQADEALNDLAPRNTINDLGAYQIFEQKLDDEGELEWEYDGFHAFPVADPSKPISGEDVFFDGYLAAGQALVDYDIYIRTDVNDDGRPISSRDGRFGKQPGTVKQQDFPLPLAGSVDREWTPMATALDGGPFINGVDGIADFDGRGNRGFLQEIDVEGEPVFLDGEPVYVPWRNASGRTVLEQSIVNLVDGAIGAVVGSEPGQGLLLSGEDLNLNYDGATDSTTIDANREQVTNAIFQGIALVHPTVDDLLPDSAAERDQIVAFDLVETANEFLLQEAIQETLIAARTEVMERIEDLGASEIFADSDDVMTRIEKIEGRIIDALEIVFKNESVEGVDGGSLTVNDFELFPEEPFNLAVRRSITDSMVAAAAVMIGDGLIPTGDEDLVYPAEDLDLVFFGDGDTEQAIAIELSITRALRATIQKLQTRAVKVAIRNAVNQAFTGNLETSDIPLDLVFDELNPLEREPAETVQADIEAAIIQAIVVADGTTVTTDDLNYKYNLSDSAFQKGEAIRQAILNGIVEAKPGSIELSDIVLNFPGDSSISTLDELFDSVDIAGYSSGNTLEQNAHSIEEGILNAINVEFGKSFSHFPEGATFSDLSAGELPSFEFLPSADLERMLTNALTDLINQAGGSTESISDDVALNPEDDTDLKTDLDQSIANAVINAFINRTIRGSGEGGENDEQLSQLHLPRNVEATVLAAFVESYIAGQIKSLFPQSGLSGYDLSIEFSDGDSLATLQEQVEAELKKALGLTLPESSFADTAGAIDVNLVEQDEYGILPETLRNEILSETLLETLQSLANQPFGFPGLSSVVTFEDYLVFLQSAGVELGEDNLDYIDDYLAFSLNRAAFFEFGPAPEDAEAPEEFSLVLNGDLPSDWGRSLEFVSQTVNRAFPGNISDLALEDGFSGKTFEEQGEAVLAVVAEALSQVTGETLVASDLSAHAFPENVLLYELDYDRDAGEITYGDDSTPDLDGFVIVATGDYDNAGNAAQDLLLWNSSTGEFLLLAMDGRRILPTFDFDTLNALLAGKVPLGYEASEGEGGDPTVSQFVEWLRSNYGSEDDPIAAMTADPDGDGASNLLEYSCGVEVAASGSPVPVEMTRSTEGDRLIEFCVRIDDADLSYAIESSADLSTWTAVSYEVVESESVDSIRARHTVRITSPISEDGHEFFRINYQLAQ